MTPKGPRGSPQIGVCPGVETHTAGGHTVPSAGPMTGWEPGSPTAEDSAMLWALHTVLLD